ncbi:MAG: hypothetical protein COB26_11195 [Piscirickettsiaceae bacterium]|nr:MAG: hypothetical protein COB89_01205 [Piscirickettsiaceae bacterium]PCI66454.1 MAG: hypothetical protein COB26_11195 [Piscirickettsiaceae bacterium]
MALGTYLNVASSAPVNQQPQFLATTKVITESYEEELLRLRRTCDAEIVMVMGSKEGEPMPYYEKACGEYEAFLKKHKNKKT